MAEALFSLRDLQEAVALAATGDWQILTDAVPQEVWDDLHERGLVSTHRDITDDAETGATAAGIAYIADRIKGTKSARRFWRETRVIGLLRGSSHSYASHPPNCECESCGPLLLLALSEYEAERLQEALEKRDGRDTGDWHGQLRMKLAEALGSWNPERPS